MSIDIIPFSYCNQIPHVLDICIQNDIEVLLVEGLREFPCQLQLCQLTLDPVVPHDTKTITLELVVHLL